ncbi:MAG TPA: TonB family protein [Terriglobales bacterium]|nr:TonB family protein [Terriglobales bacterium]
MPTGEIFFEHERWGHNLALSAALHVGVTLAIIGYAYIAYSGHGNTWGTGGTGSAMGVTMVSNIPLPSNPVQTQSILATESKGVSKSEPKPAVEEPNAIPIPARNAKKKPVPHPSETERKPPPQPPQEANNVVPFGEGGPAAGPYAIFNVGGAKGGFSVSGGGGDFASRYAWYVRGVNEKVSENWMKYEVDPRIQNANRVYVTFDIDRSGHPTHIQIEQSSGVPSLDISALRAVQRIDTFGPLPADYAGNKVSVEFWFDYKK